MHLAFILETMQRRQSFYLSFLSLSPSGTHAMILILLASLNEIFCCVRASPGEPARSIGIDFHNQARSCVRPHGFYDQRQCICMDTLGT